MSRRFRFGPRAKDIDADVRREIEAHLEQRAKEFEREGMSLEQARNAALTAFGDREEIEAKVRALRDTTVRQQRRRLWFDDIRLDTRMALRSLLKSPTFTVVALLTLGLGIGANTAVFSVLRSVILRPLPYPDSDRLVQIWTDHRARGRAEPEWLTPPQYEAYVSQNRTFEFVAGYQGWGPNLTGEGNPEAIAGGAVSADFLNVLGVPPALGRGFLPSDDDPNAEQVVILSDALWKRRFNADPKILEAGIQLNGEIWTVIGVMPESFHPPQQWEILRTLRLPSPNPCGHGCIVMQAIGRLQPGVTVAQAQVDLQAITERMTAEAPQEYEGVGSWLVPLHDQVTGPVRPALFALFGAVLFVMLLACVNLASLMLVRAGSRGREFGLRAALGAGRGRIVRQLLTESLVLAVMGGLVGLMMGWIGTRVLARMIPSGIQSVQQIRPDGIVVAFTVGLALLAGVVFGIVPALQTARADLMGVLRTAHAQGSRRLGVLRRGLVAAELAIALVLLVGAGLLLRTFLSLQQTDLGFRTDGIVTAGIFFTPARYQVIERVDGALDDLLQGLRAHPSVSAVEVADIPPLAPGGDQDMTLLADGLLPPDGQRPSGIWFRRVSHGYLSLLGVQLLEGRLFGPEDRMGTERVAVITRETARRLWPTQDAVGRFATTSTDPEATRVRIIGVIGDLRHDGPMVPIKPQVFLSLEQFRTRGATLLLTPENDRGAAIGALRSTLNEIDADMPLVGITSLDERYAAATQLPRYFATILSAFAAAALLLSVIGVYGMMAYSVSQRRQEIGVRLALGARPEGVLTLIMGEGARLALLGLGAGIVLAALSTRLLQANLYGVGKFDVPTFAVVSLILVASALLACWIPARRAGAVDPVIALREE